MAFQSRGTVIISPGDAVWRTGRMRLTSTAAAAAAAAVAVASTTTAAAAAASLLNTFPNDHNNMKQEHAAARADGWANLTAEESAEERYYCGATSERMKRPTDRPTVRPRDQRASQRVDVIPHKEMAADATAG